MYRVVFVKNMLVHGQSGKKSKKVRVFGIFKSDPGDCFLDPYKKSNYFCFNRRESLSSLIYYRTVIYKIWTVFELVGKSRKMSMFFPQLM